MEIVNLKLKELKPYENNPRVNDEAVKYVAESIKEFGFKVPIIIDKDNVIVAGHTRYKAAKKLKLSEVPCVVADDLTDEQVKAFRLADNKVAEKAEWDYELLDIELGDIFDIDMELLGFEFDVEADETEEAKESEKVKEDDFDAELPEEPKSKFGDVYVLGRHRLMCGDSTDQECIDVLMDGAKANMVLSDPPYGMHLETDYSDIKGFSQGNKYEKVIGDNDDFKPELISTFLKNFGYCKEMFLFGADYFAELLPEKNDGSWLVWDKRKESQADGIGSEFELIWSKTKHKRRMLRHDWFGFLSSENAQDARNRVHPTQKPVSLLKDIISQWGKECENIVDLYGGSGSTLIACEQLDRTCYMMELDPKYVDVIVERWERLTGEKAVLINGTENA